MYSISDLRIGTLIELDGAPFKVVTAQHVSMGRGGAVLRTRVKNLLTGAQLEKTFRPAEKISPANLQHQVAQFLYKEGTAFVFMDNQSYEQHQIPGELLAGKEQYLTEGSEATLMLSAGKIIEVSLPNSVQLKVTQSDPGVRGDTATAATKSCMVETGLKVNVPLFIKEGDVLKIDTRTGQYLERVK